MKKILITFSALLALLLCLAIGIGASDIYSDYTKEGVNGEAPLFNFLGYAIDPETNDICVNYNVDIDAVNAYEKQIGKTVSYGVVVGHKSNLNGTTPLDSKGNPTGDNANKVITIKLSKNIAILSVIIKGIEDEKQAEEFLLCMYVVEEGSVKYVADATTTTSPDPVSYDKIKGPREVTIGNITYSTDGVTEPAADRIKQKNYSDSVYNKGSEKSSSELTGFLGVKSKAQMIAAGGSLINMPMASAFMSHYLKNTGATYEIDVRSFLSEDSGALNSRNKAINNALRAAEMLAVKGKTLTINQLTEGHPMQGSLATQNWQYAIGSYFDDVDVINLTVTEVNGVKTYTADIKYIVTDFYNWDTNDYNKFKKIVSPHDLHELHKAGIAREFMSYGEYTYKSVTWTEGQTVSEIAAFN